MEMKITQNLGEGGELTAEDKFFKQRLEGIDNDFTQIVEEIEKMDLELHRLRVSSDTTKLLKYIVEQAGIPVSIESDDVPEHDFYATVRSNIDKFREKIANLDKEKKVLFSMQNTNAVNAFEEVAKELHGKLVHPDKKKLDVVAYLAQDAVELLDILEAALKELEDFDHICEYVQSLPEEEKYKIRNS